MNCCWLSNRIYIPKNFEQFSKFAKAKIFSLENIS
jgi:hypothetical protein